MSIQPPQGILNIPNATLRVGKLAVDSTAGFDTLSYTLSSSQRKQEHKTTNETPDDEKKKSRARTNLYFIIVPSTHEQRLVGVKIHPTHRSVVFVESVDQRSHAVVPQLHDTRM